jgi:hypothetical protein
VGCDSTGSRRYECAIDYGGDLVSHCAMGTNAAITRVLWQRCGAERPPEVTSEYVDCDSIGDVVSAEDVVDTEEPLTPEPTGDLKRVRVAASSDELCVEWQASAPVRPAASAHFWATSEDSIDGRAALTVSLGGDEPPEVGTLSYGSIDGRVGVEGNSISLVVERDDLPEPYRAAVEKPFTFEARAFGDGLGTSDGSMSYP